MAQQKELPASTLIEQARGREIVAKLTRNQLMQKWEAEGKLIVNMHTYHGMHDNQVHVFFCNQHFVEDATTYPNEELVARLALAIQFGEFTKKDFVKARDANARYARKMTVERLDYGLA